MPGRHGGRSPPPQTQPPEPVSPVGVGPSERIVSIAKAVQECAFAHEPDARLIGNVCAEDVADLCDAVLVRWGRPAAPPAPEVGEFIQCLQIRAASLGAEGANLSQRGDAAYFTRAATLLQQLSAPITPAPEPPAEALAARPLMEQVAQMGDRIGQHTVGEITVISDRAAAWLRENPPAPEPPPIIRYEFKITDRHGQTVASGDAATGEEAEREVRHCLAQYSQDGPCTLELRRVEVLEVLSPEPAPAAAQPPLWRAMRRAYLDAPERLDGTDRMGFAAQILAVRDRVAPEEHEPPAGDGEPWPQAYQQRSDAMWEQRQAIRAMLTAEATRAEAGE
jgi:hypothetical protein